MSLEKNSTQSSGNDLSVEEIQKKIKELVDKKVVIVNADHLMETEMRDTADILLAKEKHRAGLFGKIKKTLFYEYNRQKKINEIKEEIKETGNIYAGQLDDKEAHNNAMNSITERFSADYEGLINEEGGEIKKLLDNKSLDGVKVTGEIKNIIKDYANGTLDEDTFNSEKVRIFSLVNDENLKGASTYADNLLEIAQTVKLAVHHGMKMEELDLDFDIIVGKAKSSIKTEAKYNVVDKIIDKLDNVGVTKYISPATLSTAVGISYTVAAAFSTRLLRSKALAYGTFGASAAVSGVLMGVNESKRLADERRQHNREMAKGAEIEDGSKRREEMEGFNYETLDARSSIDEINSLLYSVDENGAKKLNNLSESDIRSALAKIADIESRNKISNQQKIDLINYSSLELVEKERTEMDILRAQSKVEIKKLLSDPKFKDIFGEKSFDEYLDSLKKATESSLLGGESGIEKKDALFRKMKNEKAAIKAVKTILVGVTIGATVQEVGALFRDDVVGLFEGAFSKDHSFENVRIQTPLENLRGYLNGTPSHLGGASKLFEDIGGPGQNFRLPEGSNIIKNLDGTFDITLGDRTIGDNLPLTFNPDGSLDNSSIEILGEHGIVASNGEQLTTGAKETTNVSAKEYIENHKEGTNQVSRKLWYDNDTVKPVFDKNELKLHWGGHNNTGMDNNGNYVFNVGKMDTDGSFHKNLSVDAQEKIKNNGLKMLLSLSRDTQNHVFEVDIDSNGNAVIDPNSEIGKLFFEENNGKAIFKGRFAEVAEMMGEKNDIDSVRLLATYEGKGIDTLTDTIDTTCTEHVTDIDLPIDTEPPYFIPVMYRNPLEPLVYKKSVIEKINNKKDASQEMNPLFYYMYGSGFKSTEEQKEKYEKEKSASLKDNVDAVLDESKEINLYLEKQDEDHRKTLEQISTEMGPMNKECKLSVCIPVAGHQEGENIYQTLKNYTLQTIDPENFEIVLLVNHPDKDLNGNLIQPDKTLEEINRFKKDFPKMNIKFANMILPIEKAKIGYIRKVLNDSVLKRQYNRGKDAPELIMVSNDADNKGLSPEYVENFISKFKKYPEAESMVGQLDWDPSSYIRNPLIHIGTRLFQYQTAQDLSKGSHFNSSGANFAFRSSIYAAVGGYSDDMDGGEDTDFGAKISLARRGSKSKKSIIYAGARTSRLYTSSRRAEMVMEKHGLSPLEQWDKGFSAFDDEVRKVNWEVQGEKMDFNDSREVEKLIIALEDVINRTIKRTEEWGGKAENSSLMRSLGWLGIKYEITGPHSIKITDASKLIKGLEEYQKEGLNILKRKTSRMEKVDKNINPLDIKEFIEILGKDPELMTKWEPVLNIYNGASNYNSLPDGELKKQIDANYDFVITKPANKGLTKQQYLETIVSAYEKKFAEELDKIKTK